MNDNDIIEIIDDTDETISPQGVKNNQIVDIEKRISEAKYDPIEPSQETIDIIDDIEPTKNKSGLVLVIILFVLLGLFILFLPAINDLLNNLF